jgi:hypothetical protein
MTEKEIMKMASHKSLAVFQRPLKTQTRIEILNQNLDIRAEDCSDDESSYRR